MGQEVFRHNLCLRGGVVLQIEGPINDLQVSLGTKGKRRLLNEMAPSQTKFIAMPGVDFSVFDRVHTKVDTTSIKVPLTAVQEHLPYALLHGIALLRLHEDKKYHAISDNAHQLLGNELSHLQARGEVTRPKNMEEIQAWEIVCREERKRGETALRLLSDMRASGLDPLPYVTNIRDLTRVVNGCPLARTARSVAIDAKRIGEQIDVPMTLPEYWVEVIMNEPVAPSLRLDRAS